MAGTAVYFDAAFDSSSSTFATGLVVWDLTENLLAVKSTIHNNIPDGRRTGWACLCFKEMPAKEPRLKRFEGN